MRGLQLGGAEPLHLDPHTPACLAQHARRQEIHHPDELGHAAGFGAAIEGFGIVQLRNLALEHHGDAVGHDQRLFLVMGHKDKGDAHLALQLDQFDLHHLAHLLVERGKRLIEKQHLGFEDQRARQCHALALPA